MATARTVNSKRDESFRSVIAEYLTIKGRATLGSIKVPNVTVLTSADERTSFPASLRLVNVPGETTLTPDLVAGTLAIGASGGGGISLANVGTGTGVADSPGVNGNLRSIAAAFGFTA